MLDFLKNWRLPAFMATALLYIMASALLHRTTTPAEFYDTDDYLRISQYTVTSLDFWTDRKPGSGPLLYKIFQRDTYKIAFFQWILSVCGWLAFSAAVIRLLTNPAVKYLAFLTFLILSLSPHVYLWHQSLLSESPATSLLVFICAVWILILELLRNKNLAPPTRMIILLLFLFLTAVWSFFRDIHMYFTLGASICAILFQLKARTKMPLFTLGVGFLFIFTVQNHLSHESGRWTDPLAHVLTKRVLVDPEATQWFADHGMPTGSQITELAGRFAKPLEQARFEPWLTEEGKSVYARWLLSQPLASIGAPLSHLEQLYDRDLSAYARNPVPRIQALFGRFFFSPILLWIFAFTMVFVSNLARNRCLHIHWHLPIILFILAGPLMFIAWHGDTMEIARHAYGANLQTRLALILGVFLAVDDLMRSSVSNKA